ncbi:MAG TPA: hypothetical protein GXX36_03100 [Clostridiaceae bacterium]|nr:hypothetical protein [Clostridiaceae bacterium]
MKPSNIIVTADNVVKAIDIGIAREYKKDSASDTSAIKVHRSSNCRARTEIQ